MLLRLAVLLLAGLLALPVAPADPQEAITATLPPLVCVYVDPGPPPFFVLRDCAKAKLGVMVNGTDGEAALWVVPCAFVSTDPPNVWVGDCRSLMP